MTQTLIWRQALQQAFNQCLPQTMNVFTHENSGCIATPQADMDINEQGVLTLLKTFNHRKGTGSESLCPALLKFLAEDIGPSLTFIFKHYN